MQIFLMVREREKERGERVKERDREKQTGKRSVVSCWAMIMTSSLCLISFFLSVTVLKIVETTFQLIPNQFSLTFQDQGHVIAITSKSELQYVIEKSVKSGNSNNAAVEINVVAANGIVRARTLSLSNSHYHTTHTQAQTEIIIFFFSSHIDMLSTLFCLYLHSLSPTTTAGTNVSKLDSILSQLSTSQLVALVKKLTPTSYIPIKQAILEVIKGFFRL